MNDVVNELFFIKEDFYQRVKKKFKKKNDWFTLEELKKLYKST